MNIVELRTDHFRVPLDRPLSDSTHGEISDFGLIVVRAIDDAEREGLGYTYTVNNVGAAAIHRVIESDLQPLLRGADPTAINEIWEKMWWHLHFVGRGGITAFAMAAVDIALWDLRGKHKGESLWRLIGGRNCEVQAYTGGIDLHLPVEELVAQTRGFLAQGFQAIKMKVGRARLSEDIERVSAMRDFLDPDVPLMVDANMRWGVDEALRAAGSLAEFDLYWLEEPIIPDDIQGHALIAREGGIPIASGENLHSVYEFENLMECGGVHFPEPDAATLGGITPWLRVARIANARGLPVTSHGIHDVHVHLLAGSANASYLEVHGFGLERFLESPLQLRDGKAVAPDRPGHGVVLNSEALEEFREKK